jgi:uncharacterized protein involved in cysteine biosynthesis
MAQNGQVVDKSDPKRITLALSRRQLGFRAKVDFMQAHSRATLGLGASTAVLLRIPLLNVLMLPMGIVGATLMVLEVEDAD